jgi:hypothetical protein
MKMWVKFTVRYRYQSQKGGAFSVSSHYGTVRGMSESAIQVELRKKHPGAEFLIEEITWGDGRGGDGCGGRLPGR